MSKRAALIRGDGTGPELVEAMILVLEAARSGIELVPCEAGLEWWKANGGDSFIPQETWRVLEGSDACFKGPTTTIPEPGTPKSVAVSIRQRFDLYANVRPIRTFPGTKRPLGDVDFVMVREGTEGLYAGIEHRLTDDLAVSVRKITKRSSERIARYAFRLAQEKGWGKVVAVHKANICKETCGLFLKSVREVAKEFPSITLEDYFVDNLAQQLVKNPQRFDRNVIVGTNLFMDILSEEAAALVASIGCVYSANIGDSYAMFEPAHGSSPKYKGLGKVNPTATILAGAWMADYLGEKEKAEAIFNATYAVIGEGKHVTYDLGGEATTMEMAREIAKRTSLLLG
ncbi:MAG: isocitrate/isopropylmalate dehydrogenase family protein [Candidatus Brockarchaeota archaeon]|nr:isocitrate/isopropylmalate dehydrogenase family protein [Candidatus Brockarchaeota archaeon]